MDISGLLAITFTGSCITAILAVFVVMLMNGLSEIRRKSSIIYIMRIISVINIVLALICIICIPSLIKSNYMIDFLSHDSQYNTIFTIKNSFPLITSYENNLNYCDKIIVEFDYSVNNVSYLINKTYETNNDECFTNFLVNKTYNGYVMKNSMQDLHLNTRDISKGKFIAYFVFVGIDTYVFIYNIVVFVLFFLL